MNMRTFCPDFFAEARKGISSAIGEDRMEEYKDIFPVLVFLKYRASLGTDARQIMADVNWGDKIIPYACPVWKSILHLFGCTGLYVYSWIKTVNKRSALTEKGGVTVFSNTFVNSRRYGVVQKQLDNSGSIQTIVAVCDALKAGGGSIRVGIQRSLSWHHGNYRPIFFKGLTISGKRLNNIATKWCQFFIDQQAEKQVADAQIDWLLRNLRQAYRKKHCQLKNTLKNKNIKAYVTVNQYNLRDLLIIHACYELGIRTVQLEHCVSQFARVNFSEKRKIPCYAFAQEYCLWSKEEEVFHKKVYKYENILDEKKELTFRVVGNIEMTYQQACEIVKKYPVERRLTFMTSAVGDAFLSTPEELRDMKKWRWSIFKRLKTLMEKQNIAIRVRYTPFKEMNFRKKEIPVLKEWGFEISESVPENLMEDICSSIAVMSTTSTVLATAKILGRKVFRLEDPAVEYIKVDRTLMDISLDDISEIKFDNALTVSKLRPDDFFQAGKLL